MRIGVVFPQTEIEPEPGPIREYAERAERLGFSHLLAYDHVLGADPAVHRGWDGPYDLESRFHEPLVLFGYLAALTTLELVAGVLILPQRQTALVAKQAATVDILAQGRLRIGVGLGWNSVEYQALGKSFGDRGRRLEAQVALLRRLWSEPSVTEEGDPEQVTGAGLAPLPVQRPIPIWFGARVAPALRRAGRLADGWFPQVGPGTGLEEAAALVAEGAEAAGRDPAQLGMEGRVSYPDGGLAELVDLVGRWQAAGASHVSINTMGAGRRSAAEHSEALAECAEALGLVGG
ncbi:MAG TPA: LLM class F420-dependent oxidoreductase [Candidatus Dormibacteraeota bacterium]